MRFGGLFVGVDRQQDPRIVELAFAARDAAALAAAFADANELAGHEDGREVTVLTGAEATAAAVRGGLARLAQVSREADFCMVMFSCHGTADGRLLFADADLDDDSTSMSLADVTDALGPIVAPMLVVAFDSCFSGLASTSAVDALARRMRALAEGNRAVVWASGSDEQAWESPRYQHGYLTYGLLSALYGTQARTAHGDLGIGPWLARAIDLCAEDARRDRRTQTPGLVMHMNADAAVPAFRVGPRRAAMLAEQRIFPVGPDLAGLGHYGFGPGAVAAVRRRIRDGVLNDLQLRAIECGLLAGRNVVVAAPTSSGKSLVGDLAALRTAARGLKTAVLVPTRALASERWAEFRSDFEPAGVRAVRAYGGVADDEHALLRGRFDVAFFTYEKFVSFAFTRPELLQALGLVVVDEAHVLGDPERGQVIELLLTRLRLSRTALAPRTATTTQIVVLSAALDDAAGLPSWLDATLIEETRRPVPLVEGVVGPSGVLRYKDAATGDPRERRVLSWQVEEPDGRSRGRDEEMRGRIALELSRELLRAGERVLVFRAHKAAARSLAMGLVVGTTLAPCAGGASADPSRASRELATCLKGGTAFHVGDLDREEREAVEAAFRAGDLRVLVATTGLAMGLNTPATAVIVADHERFDGLARAAISVADYKNMAGRAGRWIPGVDRGTAFLVAESEAKVATLYARYVDGAPEPLASQLSALAPEDLALRLLMLAEAGSERRLVEVASATFDGFHHRDDRAWVKRRRAELGAALLRLEALGFVARDGASVYEATAIGRVCGRESLRFASAERVLEASARLAAAGDPIDGLTLLALAQLTDELEDVYTPAGRDEADAWSSGAQTALGGRTRLVEEIATVCGDDVPRRTRALKRLVAIRRWLMGEPMERIEEVFAHFQRNADQPVAGAIRQAAERTSDVLRAVARLLSLRHPAKADALAEMVATLRPRLELGVNREATELLRLRAGVTRSQALRLAALGLASPAALRGALERGDERLEALLSSDTLRALQSRLLPPRPRRDDAAAERATKEFWDRLAMDDVI